MTVQFSTAVRNAMLDAIETTVGTAPEFRLYSGSMPADAATTASGTLLVTITLPSDWMAAASSGSKAKSGTWSAAASAGSATAAGYYRIYQSTTCHEQGTVTATGGGGDLTLDVNSITTGQTVTISTFSKTAGNA